MIKKHIHKKGGASFNPLKNFQNAATQAVAQTAQSATQAVAKSANQAVSQFPPIVPQSPTNPSYNTQPSAPPENENMAPPPTYEETMEQNSLKKTNGNKSNGNTPKNVNKTSPNTSGKPNANTNTNITSLASVCSRLYKLSGSISTSLYPIFYKNSPKYLLENVYESDKNKLEKYYKELNIIFLEFMHSYQGLSGKCPPFNTTRNKQVQLNSLDDLKRYLQVLWKFMLVIPIGQKAEAPVISKKNMQEFLPDIFLQDFQNAFPEQPKPPTIMRSVESMTANVVPPQEKSGGKNGNNNSPASNQNVTPNNGKSTSPNTNNENKKLNKKQTMFFKKYFKNNDPLLNYYAYMQLKILWSISNLLYWIEYIQSKIPKKNST